MKRIFKPTFIKFAFFYYYLHSRIVRVVEHVESEKLKSSFKHCGEDMNIKKPYIIVKPNYMTLRKAFTAMNNLRIEAIDNWAGERFNPDIIIGDNVVFNTDCHIGCINKVYIGNNVLLASRIYISDHSHGTIDEDSLRLPPVKRPLYSKGPVIIKDNVWIGEGVSILPNITIGENAIIGANAVVTKDVPANAIVAGNPARIIKQL